MDLSIRQNGRSADGSSYERPYQGPIELGLTFADGTTQTHLVTLAEENPGAVVLYLPEAPTKIKVDPLRRFLEADRGDNILNL